MLLMAFTGSKSGLEDFCYVYNNFIKFGYIAGFDKIFVRASLHTIIDIFFCA